MKRVNDSPHLARWAGFVFWRVLLGLGLAVASGQRSDTFVLALGKSLSTNKVRI